MTGELQRERSFGRLVAFADAVVAIAITLLGLPLIDIAGDLAETGNVAQLLAENGGRIFAFLLSFTVIAVFWMGHHRMYDRLIGYTPGLIWANMAWLATLVFLPFPTELVATASGSDDLGISVLYVGTTLATALTMMLQVAIVRRHPEVVEPGEVVSYIPTGVVAGSLALALVIGILIPALNLWSLTLVAPSQWVARAVMSRRNPVSDVSRAGKDSRR